MEPHYKFHFRNRFMPLASLSLHEAACMECPAGYTLPLEKPDAYALYCVVTGKGIYTLSGREFPLETGQCFVMYPDMPVVCRSDKKDPWTLCGVSFDGADARLLLNAAGFEPKNPVIRPATMVAEQIVDIIAHIYTYRGQEIYSLAQSTALLYALMAFLIKSASWNQSAMPPGWTGAIHFQKALEYIANNYARSITVNDIARHVNLSRSRLYRVFMEQIFISPQQYLTDFRVREACRLLEKRSGSIKEIALAVGFEDPLYFSTLFKKLTGKSPRDYTTGLTESKNT
ncbi:MAG: AraC family transcriptional regulator [Spirochaetales bacterium]|nr:AraC family transcriptional regulator [Spirochaetales bacterium]